MKIKHHIARRFQVAKEAPLWKWVVVIFIVAAMPLFFAFANTMQTQQAIDIDDQESLADNTTN